MGFPARLYQVLLVYQLSQQVRVSYDEAVVSPERETLAAALEVSDD